MLPHWAKPLWASTLREKEDRREKGGGRGRKKREAEEEEDRRKRKEKEKEKFGDEPDNMPRLATKRVRGGVRGRKPVSVKKTRKRDEKA